MSFYSYKNAHASCCPGMIAGDGEEQDAYILGIQEPVEEFEP